MEKIIGNQKPKVKERKITFLLFFQAYFFDQYKMTDGQPPNDRGCRACGKIGHLVRDCPKKKASDDHKKARKDHERGNKNNAAKGYIFLIFLH